MLWNMGIEENTFKFQVEFDNQWVSRTPASKTASTNYERDQADLLWDSDQADTAEKVSRSLFWSCLTDNTFIKALNSNPGRVKEVNVWFNSFLKNWSLGICLLLPADSIRTPRKIGIDWSQKNLAYIFFLSWLFKTPFWYLKTVKIICSWEENYVQSKDTLFVNSK